MRYQIAILGLLMTLGNLSCDADGTAAPSTESPVMIEASPARKEAQTWSSWKKRSTPVFTGQYSVSSDPCVIREADGYRMYYTGLDPEDSRTILCAATSKDGLQWEEVKTDKRLKGLVFRGKSGNWDENMESAYVINWQGKELLYYSGYQDKGTIAKGFPANLGLAFSSDKKVFKPVSLKPIVETASGGPDSDAIYSAVFAPYQKQLAMVYVGHAYSNKNGVAGVFLLGATSDSGVKWSKNKEIVLKGSDKIPWTKDGVAEPALLEGPDGFWYLFFTGLKDEERVIGIARGKSPFGPWEINPEPIVTPSTTSGAFDEHQVLAPSVIIENGIVKMWYLGANKEGALVCGYAESNWPLYRSDSQSKSEAK